LLALGFIAFGLIGGKRALFLYLPVVVLFIGFYMRERLKRAFVYLILVSVLILLTGYLSIRLMPTLNPQQRVGGEVDLDYVLNYLTHYTMARFEGSSGGRVITSIQVFEILRSEGLPSVLFGLGPGTYMETRFEALQTTLVETDSLPIKYGVPGSSWLAIQVGYVGAFIYHLLFIVILAYAARFFKTETDPYWKAFGLGMVGFSFVMFLISLTYWPVFIDDLLPLIYFMLAGFLVLKKIKTSGIEQSA
jgi:O-antigen ligase